MTGAGWRIAAFAAAYLAITSLTVGFTRFGGGLALVWFGTGVGAAMLLGLPRRLWAPALAALMAASALATSLFGFGPRLAAPFALVNALEAWLVARLLIFARPRRDWLDSPGGLFWTIVIGGFAAPAIAAVPGGLAASFGAGGAWHAHAASWWAAHGLGTLIGFPLAMLAAGATRVELRARWSRAAGLELAGHCALILAVSALAIGQTRLPLLFLPIVPVLFAAFRCGREGAALGTVIVAGATLAALNSDTNPLASSGLSAAGEVLFFQFYLCTVSLLAIPVSVALRHHQLVLAELEDRKALRRLFADHSDDALLNLDQQGHIRFASPAGHTLSGRGELLGEPLAAFFDPLDELLVRALLTEAAATPGETRMLERPVLRGEEQVWLEARICAVLVEGKPGALQGYAATIRDVTARKQVELAAIHAAETDPLTGLPNRRALLRRLDLALAHAAQRPFALAIVDLDHFKAVNDTHGHLAGDTALREVAGAMRRLAGPGRFFARLGGEEFALIVVPGEREACLALCERLRAHIAALELTSARGMRFRVTGSIGLALIDSPRTAAQALQAADALLYRAKHAGRNRIEASGRAPALSGARRAA